MAALMIFLNVTEIYGQNCTHNGGVQVILFNTTWSGTHDIPGDVQIPSGVKLTVTGTVHMRPGGKITVDPNGELIVNGGQITTLCSSMWSGIYVKGNNMQPQGFPVGSPNPQGVVRINNGATIEHAEIGVSLWDRVSSATSGGILLASHANFINNQMSIQFVDYPGFGSGIMGNYYAQISFCKFKDDSNLKPLPLLPNPINIWAQGVTGVTVAGCEFETANYFGSLQGGPRAVQGWNASVRVVIGCDSSTPLPIGTPCPPQYIVQSTFDNYFRGVLVFGSPYNNVLVDDAKFLYNYTGISIQDNDNPTVIRNFVQTRFQPAPLPMGFNFIFAGIELSECDGFSVEENDVNAFANYSFDISGIYIENAGKEENEVYKNTVSNISPVNLTNDGGSALLGALYNRDGAADFKGLQFICNTTNNNTRNILVEGGTGHPDLGIRQVQGEYDMAITTLPLYPAKNFFNNPSSYLADIHNLSHHFEYLHVGGNTEPLIIEPLGSVTPLWARNDRTCPSNLGGGVEPGGGDEGGDGLFLRLTPEQESQLYTDLETHLPAYEQMWSEFKQNLDGGDSYELQTQIMTVTDFEEADDLFNQIISISPYLSTQTLKALASNGYFLQAQVLDACLQNPDATKSLPFLQFLQEQAVYPMNEEQIQQIMDEWETETDRTVHSMMLSSHGVFASRAIKRLLSDKKIDLFENSEEIKSLYAMWPGIRYKYALVEHLYHEHRVEEAKSVMNGLPINYELSSEELAEHYNYVDWFNFRLAVYASGRNFSELSPEEIEELQDIADNSGRRSGNMAQNTLCFFYGICDKNNPEFEQESSQLVVPKSDLFVVNTELEQVKIYPNPATNEVNLELPAHLNDAPLHIIVYDTEGKLMMQQNTVSTGKLMMDISMLSTGNYIISIVHNGQVISMNKLIKE